MIASAVVLSWNRPETIPQIVQSLSEWPFIGEIIIADNSQETHPDWAEMFCEFGRERLKVLRFDRNRCTWSRFLAARHAARDVIYTQDDDSIVHNVDELYAGSQALPEAITAGLADDAHSRHYRMEANTRPWLLLGWGAFFSRKALELFDGWVTLYGEDELLCRKADRIFTVLHGCHQPLKAKITRLRDVRGRRLDNDRNALWLRNDHAQLNKEAVAKALEIRASIQRP